MALMHLNEFKSGIPSRRKQSQSQRKKSKSKRVLSPAAISMSIILSIVCWSSQNPNNIITSDAFLLPLGGYTNTHTNTKMNTNTNTNTYTATKSAASTSKSTKPSFLDQHGYEKRTNRCYRHIPLFMADTSESLSETETESSTETDSSIAIESAADSNANGTPGPDIPMPTEAGGFSHTSASRAKISAANKGKIPWNKGKTRSEEVKKRIAEGVKRKNREKFLQKLDDLGVTEEEFEHQKKEERKEKDAERRARRTENGGYRPTEETKEKISKILKEKHAKGEIKKRKYEGPFRKGFTHSEETKEKIRESLRRKWAEDPEYAANMRSKGTGNNTTARARISKTLKDKWQDPKFRDRMLKSMKKRKTPSVANSRAQREKISEAMKKKWQDAGYRKKAMEGMEKYRDNLPPKPQKTKAVTRTSANAVDRIIAMTPITIGAKKMKRRGTKVKVSSATAGVINATKKKVKSKVKTKTKAKSKVKLASTAEKKNGPKIVKEKTTKEVKDDGDISRMREERRDLYDLLYGDEGDAANEEDEESIIEAPSPGVIDIDLLAVENEDEPDNGEPKGLSNLFTGVADLDDDNLDDFDPYNLDDY